MYSKFLLFVFGFLMFTGLSAQVNGFNYKAVIYNNGTVVANQSVTLRFTYYQGSTQMYQETFTTTTSNSGIVIVNMGEGTIVSGDLSNLDISVGISYKVEVNLGSGYTDMGTYDFKNVPSALYASEAGSLSNPLGLNDLTDAKTGTNSVFIGANSGSVDPGNNINIGIGNNTLVNNTTGVNNIAIGLSAMSTGTSNSQNTAIGLQSLQNAENSHDNIALGCMTLFKTTNGANNVALGSFSLYSNDTGFQNVAVGSSALYTNSTGLKNTAIGTTAGYLNTGTGNIFIGNAAGYNETGSNKLYIANSNTANPLLYGDFATALLKVNGHLAVADGTQGAGKVFTSDAAGNGTWQSFTQGATGIDGLTDGKTDASSLFLGNNAGQYDDGTNYNVAVGQNCMTEITSGFNNVAVGTGALSSNTTAGQNTALGSNTLAANTASGNTAAGYAALNANNTGTYNTAIGYASMISNQSGGFNATLGHNSLRSNSTGNYNTIIGPSAGYSNSAGNNNVMLGYASGYYATGSSNVFLGNYAGYNETGNAKLYIDNTSTSNPLVYGDFSTNELKVNGNLIIYDGTQGAGKIFTSDANGKGSWKNNAKEYIIMIPPTEAQSSNSSVELTKNYVYCYIQSAVVANLYIPLKIPQGAVISSVTYYYTDNSATSNIRFQFIRTNVPGNSIAGLHSFSSSGDSTAVQAEEITTNITVTENYAYNIIIDADGSSWTGNSLLSFRGVKITYTY